jgi:hypothetical protein
MKEDGWKGAEQYPPILSAMIKVARFIVVQQGLELADLIDESTAPRILLRQMSLLELFHPIKTVDVYSNIL